MNKKEITATVFRFDPSADAEPYYKEYIVPIVSGSSAMTILDYIYENMDGTLSYYDHAGCDLGICMRCHAMINGKPGLLCQTIIDDDVTIEPLKKESVLKDLVPKKKNKQ